MNKAISLFLFLILLSTIVLAGTSAQVRLNHKHEKGFIKLTYTPPRKAVFYMVDLIIPEGWGVFDISKNQVTIYKNHLRFFGISRDVTQFEPRIYYLKPNITGKYKLCDETTSILEDKEWDGKLYQRCFEVKVR